MMTYKIGTVLRLTNRSYNWDFLFLVTGVTETGYYYLLDISYGSNVSQGILAEDLLSKHDVKVVAL